MRRQQLNVFVKGAVWLFWHWNVEEVKLGNTFVCSVWEIHVKTEYWIDKSSSLLNIFLSSVEANCDLWPSHLSGVDLLPNHSAWGQVLPHLWWWGLKCLCCSETLFVCRFYCFGWNSPHCSHKVKKLILFLMSSFPFSCSERKEPKDMKALERVDEHLEGRYYLSCLWPSFLLPLLLWKVFLLYCVAILYSFPQSTVKSELFKNFLVDCPQ